MDVFVYGTLTEPDTVGELLESFVFLAPATLHGLHAVDGRYPTLAPGGQVGGRLLRTEEVPILDRYEGVDRGLYIRIRIPLVDEASSRRRGTGADSDSDSESEPAPESISQSDSERASDAGTDPSDFRAEAAVYVGDPDRLEADVSWPGSGPFESRVREYIATTDVWVEPETADGPR